MKNAKIEYAMITKTVTVRLISAESYKKLIELGYTVNFLGFPRKA